MDVKELEQKFNLVMKVCILDKNTPAYHAYVEGVYQLMLTFCKSESEEMHALAMVKMNWQFKSEIDLNGMDQIDYASGSFS